MTGIPGGNAMKDSYTISELANEFGVSTRTLRFYESENLIDPVRRGRQRVCRREDRARLKLILRSKRLGMSLAEIGEILDLYDKEPGNEAQAQRALAIIDTWRGELARHLLDVETMSAELDRIEGNCQHFVGAGRAGERRLAE